MTGHHYIGSHWHRKGQPEAKAYISHHNSDGYLIGWVTAYNFDARCPSAVGLRITERSLERRFVRVVGEGS